MHLITGNATLLRISSGIPLYIITLLYAKIHRMHTYKYPQADLHVRTQIYIYIYMDLSRYVHG